MNELKFNQVFADHKEVVLQFVQKIVYPKIEVADEITDDVFLKVYHNLNNFDENKSSLRTWIYNIAKHTVSDYFRSIKLENKSKVNFLDYKHYTDLMYNLNSDSSTDDEMIYSDTMLHLMKAIKKMDATLQTIADLRFFKGLKYSQIAIQLNIPINTVKTDIKRIKEYLHQNIELV